MDEVASGDSIPYPSGYSDNPNAHFGSRFFISREPLICRNCRNSPSETAIIEK